MYDLPDNIHNLRQEMAKRATQFDDDALLQRLGYPKPKERDRSHLRYVLNDPALGIFHWPFPFVHNGQEFIRRLGLVLNIDLAMLDDAIACIEHAAAAAAERFIPQLFVDTQFKRTTQPIFALAVCEHQRHIQLDDATLGAYFKADENHRIALVGQVVREHYAQHGGRLGIWGTIGHYALTLRPDKVVMLRPDGSVAKNVAVPVPAQAKLLYKNKAIPLQRVLRDGSDENKSKIILM